jgi:hypothetical protein
MAHASPRDDDLRQRYADLVQDAEDDPEYLRLLDDLDSLANVPPPTQTRARIGQHLLMMIEQRLTPAASDTGAHMKNEIDTTQQPRNTPGGRRALRPLLAACIAIVALLLITGAGAYALGLINPGLKFQLGVPAATGPKYTNLAVTHAVGDKTINVSRAALTTKQVIIGYTYEFPATSEGPSNVCALSLTSDHADTFRQTVVDTLPQGVKNGVASGSEVLYFRVTQLDSSRQDRHLTLTLHLCDAPNESGAVAFDFTLPVQEHNPNWSPVHG